MHGLDEVDVSSPLPPKGQFMRSTPFPLNDKEEARMRLRRAGGFGNHTSPRTLETMPDVNALSMVIRFIHGGRKKFLEYVKFAAMNDDSSAKAFWHVYSTLPERTRKTVSFDDVCIAAGLRPDVLVPSLVGHAMRLKVDASDLVQATLQPGVIAAWGQSAMRITGEHAEVSLRDRTMFLQAAGLVPVPKGASIHLHANATANSQASAAAAAHPSVPSFLDDVDLEKSGPPAGFLEGQTEPTSE